MDIEAERLPLDVIYKLMVGLIVPRPIAWVTSISPGGVVNLAPFSAFTYLSTEPPLIGISVMRRGEGLKDTARNIAEQREFVVNIADETLVEAVHLSSIEHPPTVSEAELLGLALVPSTDVMAPRLAVAPAAMECTLERTIAFGKSGARLIVGRIRRFHVRDDLLCGGKIDTERLRPVCRLGGPKYAGLGPVFSFAPVRAEGSYRSAS